MLHVQIVRTRVIYLHDLMFRLTEHDANKLVVFNENSGHRLGWYLLVHFLYDICTLPINNVKLASIRSS